MTELITKTIEKIQPLDKAAMAGARARQGTLTKPTGSLGRLEGLSVQLAGIQGKAIPEIRDKAIVIIAADHGVAAEGTSAYPQEVTAQMVLNFLSGGAGINVIAEQVGARITVVDIGVMSPIEGGEHLVSRKVMNGTRSMTAGPAMTMEEAMTTIETGIEIVAAETEKGLDIVGTGDMGIGNTTASSAICSVMPGRPVAEVTGRGTGVDDGQLKHKIAVIEKALQMNTPLPGQPFEVLARVGGLEIGGLTGVMLGAAARRLPVVIDGFISGAAALIATAVAPNVSDYLIAAHVSVEAGHRVLLDHLGLQPLLDLGLRLGEGTGATLGIFLSETSTQILAKMATFSEAGVSERS